MSAEQGYLFIAFGPDRYLHMAAACVLSLRRGDPHRPCQLVCDRDDLGAYAPLFQVVTRAHEQGDFRGPLAKLRAYEYSQFEATMFVDCDCLCVGRWMDEEWRLVQGRDFTLPSNAAAKGKWYEQDVRSLFLDGTSRFVKGGRPVAPAITHFVGTRPHDLYLREINKLRGGAGFEALAAL